MTYQRTLRKARLVVVAGPEEGREMVIDRPRLLGGRSAVNDLVLADKAVSSAHFEILALEEGYRLRDLDSTNGTYCGPLRIKEVFLDPGACFRVGHSELCFQPQAEFIHIPLSEHDHFEGLLGSSLRMREIFAQLEKLATTELRVSISGETGTGKRLLARALHQASPRRQGPLVGVECGALPRERAESALFGQRGVFEQAQGGTLLLHEVGELALPLQLMLLRVLEQRTVRTDVRVVATSSRDLRHLVYAGAFREDLYLRLALAAIELPPLRERRDDIPLLAESFLRPRGPSLGLAPEALRALVMHDWPGNVRELRGVVERAAALVSASHERTIQRSDLHWGPDPPAEEPAAAAPPLPRGLAFKEAKQRLVDAFERAYLADLIERNGANITRSANEAGLTRFHLRELLKRHALAGRGADPETE